jgi:hypothetical protein
VVVTTTASSEVTPRVEPTADESTTPWETVAVVVGALMLFAGSLFVVSRRRRGG